MRAGGIAGQSYVTKGIAGLYPLTHLHGDFFHMRVDSENRLPFKTEIMANYHSQPVRIGRVTCAQGQAITCKDDLSVSSGQDGSVEWCINVHTGMRVWCFCILITIAVIG